jgi:hypothetical protein
MASGHAKTAAPLVSGKPSPPPKWHALLDRMAANPLDAGSRRAHPTRRVGSALPVKVDRGPDRPSAGRAGQKRATAGHDPTIESALDTLRAYECEKSKARAASSARRQSVKDEAAVLAEARSSTPAKRGRENTAEESQRDDHHEHKHKKKKHQKHHHRHHHHHHHHHRHRQRHPRRASSPDSDESTSDHPEEDVPHASDPLPLGGADNRAKLESAIERARRVEAESDDARRADSEMTKKSYSDSSRRAFGEFLWRRSCADLVGLLDDAYGSFLGKKATTA